MAWGIIIAFATLFGTLVLVMADAMEGTDPDTSLDERAEGGQEDPVRKAA